MRSLTIICAAIVTLALLNSRRGQVDVDTGDVGEAVGGTVVVEDTEAAGTDDALGNAVDDDDDDDDDDAKALS